MCEQGGKKSALRKAKLSPLRIKSRTLKIVWMTDFSSLKMFFWFFFFPLEKALFLNKHNNFFSPQCFHKNCQSLGWESDGGVPWRRDSVTESNFICCSHLVITSLTKENWKWALPTGHEIYLKCEKSKPSCVIEVECLTHGFTGGITGIRQSAHFMLC